MPAPQADRVRGVLADLATDGWREIERPYGAVRFELWAPARDATAAGRLDHALRRSGVDLRVRSERQDDEWRDGLRRLHQPIEVGGRLRVRPPWVPPREDLIDIEIDPGMAFGTGQHATTRGCLELMLAVPLGSVLDVGCGTGVLAIAARLLGHDPVSAIDTDPLAVEATIRNAKANGAGLRVSGRDAADPAHPAVDLILANITEVHVAALAGAVADRLPRHVVLSGFRPVDADAVAAAWTRHGFRVDGRAGDSDWTALRLVRG